MRKHLGFPGTGVVSNLQFILLWLYLLIGPAAWLLFAVIVPAGRRRITRIRRPGTALPPEPPKVTVLVPAKDEAGQIHRCIDSLLAQDYPDFEIILIDDRSDDDTGRIMDRYADAHRRLRVVHIEPDGLPAGWTGKCNALHTGLQSASGQWLLFVDSDVVLEPDALSTVLGYSLYKKFDMASLLARTQGHTFWERLITPVAGATLSAQLLLALTNQDSFRSIAFASGAFILMKRSVHDAIGGHAAVRDRMCEDLEMARLIKAAGFRTRIFWGGPFAQVRMYDTLPQTLRGWGRIFAAGTRRRVSRIIPTMLFVLLSVFSSYIVLAFGGYQYLRHGTHELLALTAAVHLGLMTFLLAAIYRWSGVGLRYALLLPVSAAVMLGVLAVALKRCINDRLEWRGTRYSQAFSSGASAR